MSIRDRLDAQAIALEATTNARVEELHELVVGQLQQPFEIGATVRELLVRVLLTRDAHEGFFFGGLREKQNTRATSVFSVPVPARAAP